MSICDYIKLHVIFLSRVMIFPISDKNRRFFVVDIYDRITLICQLYYDMTLVIFGRCCGVTIISGMQKL